MTRSINLFLLLFYCSILLCVGCQKHSSAPATSRADLIRAAQNYMDSISSSGHPGNFRAAQPKTICWDLADFVPVGRTKGILVPMIFKTSLLMKANFVGGDRFHIDYLTELLFYKDSAGRAAVQVITSFPDSNYFKEPTGAFTGIKFIEDWIGHPLQKLLYSSDGSVWQYTPKNKETESVTVTTTCYTISGYNYSPASSEVYTWTEDAGCSIDFSYDKSDGSNGGGARAPGGGAGGAGGAAAVTVLPGTSVIKSIKNYFQCFTNVGGSDHSYTVTVCVDQPDPGTRTPWEISGSGSSGSSGGGNPINSGHTFLILKETYGSTTITRNVGFYPSTPIWPASPSASGQFNDDENHSYNISGSFNVDDAQFFNILSFIADANTTSYLYNLSTNNCTTFAINAVAQAGISLPRTTGTWPGGAGNDPGDVGEDIRTTPIPGMTVSTAIAGVHQNVGQCN